MRKVRVRQAAKELDGNIDYAAIQRMIDDRIAPLVSRVHVLQEANTVMHTILTDARMTFEALSIDIAEGMTTRARVAVLIDEIAVILQNVDFLNRLGYDASPGREYASTVDQLPGEGPLLSGGSDITTEAKTIEEAIMVRVGNLRAIGLSTASGQEYRNAMGRWGHTPAVSVDQLRRGMMTVRSADDPSGVGGPGFSTDEEADTLLTDMADSLDRENDWVEEESETPVSGRRRRQRRR